MKLENLSYFEDVCKLKSFTKAADLNFISQSTISKYIAEVENFFGTCLIKREKFSKEVNITENGKKVLKFCSDINNNLEKLFENIQENNESFEVKIGMPPLVGNRILKKYFLTFFRESELEEMSIEIDEGSVSELKKELLNGSIDFALTYYLYKIPKEVNLKTIFLSDMEFNIFGNVDNIKNLDRKNFFDALNNKVIISLNKGTMYNSLIAHIIEKHKINPKKIVYVNTFEMLQKLLNDGIGITVLGQESSFNNKNIISAVIKSDIRLNICFEYYKYRELSLMDKKILLLIQRNI